MRKSRLLWLILLAYFVQVLLCCVLVSCDHRPVPNDDEHATVETVDIHETTHEPDGAETHSGRTKLIPTENGLSTVARFFTITWSPLVYLASMLLGMFFTRMFDESPLSPLPVRPLPTEPVGKNPPRNPGGASPVQLFTFPWPYYARSFSSALRNMETMLSKALNARDDDEYQSRVGYGKASSSRKGVFGDTIRQFIRDLSEVLKEERVNIHVQEDNHVQECELTSSSTCESV